MNRQSWDDIISRNARTTFAQFLTDMSKYTDVFREKAINAFKNNDRYSCAIYYMLYTVAINYNHTGMDIYIKEYLLNNVFFPDSIVKPELTIEEGKKKEIVDDIFNRSYTEGI